MRRKVTKLRIGPTPAIREIRREIAAVDLLCAGTLLKRWKQCGRSNCRCAHDPAARHGPYYEWSRRRNGRLLHTLLSAGGPDGPGHQEPSPHLEAFGDLGLRIRPCAGRVGTP